MKKMKKTIFVLILCNLMLLLTACQHAQWTEKEILFGNRANDTIFVLVGSGRPFTSVEAMEKYERGWASQIPPSGHSTEQVLHAEEMIVYCALLRKQTLDKYSKEEIVEKSLVELYSYSYQDLKKMDFKIVYSGENPTDSIHTVSM